MLIAAPLFAAVPAARKSGLSGGGGGARESDCRVAAALGGGKPSSVTLRVGAPTPTLILCSAPPPPFAPPPLSLGGEELEDESSVIDEKMSAIAALAGDPSLCVGPRAAPTGAGGGLTCCGPLALDIHMMRKPRTPNPWGATLALEISGARSSHPRINQTATGDAWWSAVRRLPRLDIPARVCK
eukprot:gene7914-biopygen21099